MLLVLYIGKIVAKAKKLNYSIFASDNADRLAFIMNFFMLVVLAVLCKLVEFCEYFLFYFMGSIALIETITIMIALALLPFLIAFCIGILCECIGRLICCKLSCKKMKEIQISLLEYSSLKCVNSQYGQVCIICQENH